VALLGRLLRRAAVLAKITRRLVQVGGRRKLPAGSWVAGVAQLGAYPPKSAPSIPPSFSCTPMSLSPAVGGRAAGWPDQKYFKAYYGLSVTTYRKRFATQSPVFTACLGARPTVSAATTPDAVEEAHSWAVRIGRRSIVVRDSPGFATSRLRLVIRLEAIRMVEAGVASAEDVDLGMVLRYKLPVGPLRVTDIVGLDVLLVIAEHLHAKPGPRFEPPPPLRAEVAAGELDQKSGRGFYDWEA
jgi:hypothetical protein